jgi:uncharacterized metal-binding protein
VPSGRAHAFAAELTIAASIIGYGVTRVLELQTISPQDAGAVLAGLVIGLLITPDIDMKMTTYEERRIERWLGKLPKRLWMLYWDQYARGIRHRCPLSHAPIRSTLIRFAYMWPFWIAVWWFIPRCPYYLPYFLAGWIAQDTLHFSMDILAGEMGLRR